MPLWFILVGSVTNCVLNMQLYTTTEILINIMPSLCLYPPSSTFLQLSRAPDSVDVVHGCVVDIVPPRVWWSLLLWCLPVTRCPGRLLLRSG